MRFGWFYSTQRPQNKIKETLKAQKRQMTENDISYKTIGVAKETHTSIGFCPAALRFFACMNFAAFAWKILPVNLMLIRIKL